MQRMQILFAEPQLKELRKIADDQDRPVSELIRNAVDFYLSRYGGRGVSEAAEVPPAYSCGEIRAVADDLRDIANEDRGL